MRPTRVNAANSSPARRLRGRLLRAISGEAAEFLGKSTHSAARPLAQRLRDVEASPQRKPSASTHP
jgi:hypothetical protein